MGRLPIAVAVVGILGVAAFVLGIVAQFHRVKLENVRVAFDRSCSHSATPASGLAITGALLILAAQIVANVLGGCICCCRRNNTMARSCSASYVGAIVCLVLSWMVTVLAFVLLLTAGVLNSSISYNNDDDTCQIPPGWLLPAGAVVALLSTILLLLFLLLSLSPCASKTMAGASQQTPVATAYEMPNQPPMDGPYVPPKQIV